MFSPDYDNADYEIDMESVQENDDPELCIDTVSVNAFKHGLALFCKRG